GNGRLAGCVARMSARVDPNRRSRWCTCDANTATTAPPPPTPTPGAATGTGGWCPGTGATNPTGPDTLDAAGSGSPPTSKDLTARRYWPANGSTSGADNPRGFPRPGCAHGAAGPRRSGDHRGDVPVVDSAVF